MYRNGAGQLAATAPRTVRTGRAYPPRAYRVPPRAVVTPPQVLTVALKASAEFLTLFNARALPYLSANFLSVYTRG